MGNVSNPSEAPVDEVLALRAKNAELEHKLKVSEAARYKCEERFKDLAENIQEVFWICDPGLTQTLYISPTYEEIWGRSCQSLYEDPQSFLEAIHPQDRDRILSRLSNQEWTGYCEEYRIIRPDDDIRWIRDRAWPVRDESGKVIRVVGIAEDITQYKNAQDALLRWEHIFQHAGWGVVIVNPTTHALEVVNPAFAKMHGYEVEELVGRSLADTFAEASKNDLPVHAAIVQRQGSHEYESLHIRKDGTEFPVLTNVTAFKDKDGKVSFRAATFQDISERKGIEKDFKESEAKFRVMAETVPDILFTGKPDGSCDFVNQRLYEYTGLPSGSGLGFGWAKALHPDDLERCKDKWLHTVHVGLSYEDRYRFISPNGTYRWFMARAIPVKKANGQIEKYFGVSTDIHDLVQTQEALRHSEERLDHAMNAVGEGVWDWDLRTDKVLYSRHWCELLELVPEEVEPHLNSWKSLVHPEDLPKAMATLESHLSGQTSVCRCEVRLTTKSGIWKWYLNVSKVVDRDQDGRPLRMIGIDADITEQKQRQVLLETMYQAQSQFIGGNNPSDMFDHLLTNLLSITQSEYGFIGETLFTPEGKPYLKTQAITNIAWNQETREMYERFAPNLEFFNLNSLFGAVITTGQPVLANNPVNDPRRAGLPKGHPPVHAFLGLPFYRGDRLVGMVGIANRPEGYDEWLIAYLQPLLTSCGMIIEAFQNSQQRVQAEANLRATEQMYRQILDSISDMVFVKDQNSSILWANKSFRDYYNMTNGELRGLLDSPFNKPEFTKQYHEDDAYVLNTGKISNIPEEPITRQDGQVRLFHTIKAPLFGENGEMVKLVGVARDITERKAAEDALKESEERFRLLNEAIPQQVWTARPNGLLDYVNPRVIEYFDYPAEKLIGQGWQDVVHPDDLPECLKRWAHAVETNQPYEIEFRLRRGRDQAFRWHLSRALPILNQDGQVVKWFGTNTDITQFKEMEDKVRQAQKMEAIGTLAGGIAHDFNNILTAIIGFAELAQFNVSGNDRAERNLGEVLNAGQRAKELVQQILTFSRQTEQTRQPLNLQFVVKEALKFLRATLPANIEIRQQFTEDPTIIWADPIQMHQVVMNLCTNAEYAMREHGGVLEVTIHWLDGASGVERHLEQKGESWVSLTVRDTGVGMTSEMVRRIFDPFFTTKMVGQGTGMGLAVVHGIVTSLGGVITVDSEPGQGTTFTLSFPLMKMAESLDQDEPLQPKMLLGHERILFVEDEETLAKFGKEALELLGYEVIVRTSSVEALEAFRSDPFRFDVVITDQTMPNLTGDALACELLQIRPDVPIILCTGFSHVISPEKAKAIGIRAFLFKPLLIKDLGRTLKEVLHA